MVGTPENYFAEQLQHIAKLTPERISAVATRYLDPAQLRIATAF